MTISRKLPGTNVSRQKALNNARAKTMPLRQRYIKSQHSCGHSSDSYHVRQDVANAKHC